MSKIDTLPDWKFDNNNGDPARLVSVAISLKYPDPIQFIELEPKERVKKINLTYKENLRKLIALKLFDKFELTGKKKRPTGVKTTITYNNLSMFEQLEYIGAITIHSVEGTVLKRQGTSSRFKYYCVKMTVVIEIEGILAKTESVEDRFVLIKAKSIEDAYERLEKQKADYAEPYLNSDGGFVRWHIESFDDCYEAVLSNDGRGFSSPEGVEIYSKLRSRKTKRAIAWDGRW